MSPTDIAEETDADGNTVFHRAVIKPHLGDDLAALAARAAALYIDADQPNRAGRTPLHVLCSHGWDEYLLPGDALLKRHVQRFLQYVRRVDAADPRGVRPLHIAAMLSEMLVRELLAAGADPAAAAAEGLTPLHLAARGRQSNVVGVLLNAVRARGPRVAAAAVDARDEAGWQPLHYACRSGRLETVALLLADARSRDGGAPVLPTASSLLDACAEFAQEQPLWETYRRPDAATMSMLFMAGSKDGWNDDVSGGTGRLDTLRPWVAAGPPVRAALLEEFASDDALGMEADLDEEGGLSEERLEKKRREADDGMNNAYGGIRSDQDTTQVRPILQMLREAFPPAPLFLQSLRQSIQKLEAARTAETADHENGTGQAADSDSTSPSRLFHAYTLQCFRHFASELENDPQQPPSSLGAPLDDGRSVPEAVFPWDGKRMVERLLRQHKHAAIPPLLLRWAAARLPDAAADETGRPTNREKQYWLAEALRRLVGLGQADVLATAWANNTGLPLLEEAETVGTSEADPLLYLACRRELPNIDVVRLLVETCRVDVNGRSMTNDEFEEARTEPPPEFYDDDEPAPGHATALHELARGCYWWGPAQAMPYLIAHGADLAAQNENGQTPLDVARDSTPHGPFRKEALGLLEQASSC